MIIKSGSTIKGKKGICPQNYYLFQQMNKDSKKHSLHIILKCYIKNCLYFDKKLVCFTYIEK